SRGPSTSPPISATKGRTCGSWTEVSCERRKPRCSVCSRSPTDATYCLLAPPRRSSSHYRDFAATICAGGSTPRPLRTWARLPQGLDFRLKAEDAATPRRRAYETGLRWSMGLVPPRTISTPLLKPLLNTSEGGYAGTCAISKPAP